MPRSSAKSRLIRFQDFHDLLDAKQPSIHRTSITIRNREFDLDLIGDIGECREIDGYGTDIVWDLSEIFLSHFAGSDHPAPRRHALVNSTLFSSSICNSDLILVAKHQGKPVAFASFDFLINEERTILSKATFSHAQYDTRFGLGNLLNVIIGVISAQYCWIKHANQPLKVLARTQHPLQISFCRRHGEQLTCSTTQNLTKDQRAYFARLARRLYPHDGYEDQTGIARGVYTGPGAPPPAPQVTGVFEQEISGLGQEDALYFITEQQTESSPKFQRSARLVDKVLGSKVLNVSLFISKFADFK